MSGAGGAAPGEHESRDPAVRVAQDRHAWGGSRFET